MNPLAPYRDRIDRLDTELVRLLGECLAVVREVARVKEREGIATVLPDRVEAVKERAARLGGKAGLDPGFVRALYGLIIDEACRVEDALIAEARAGG